MTYQTLQKLYERLLDSYAKSILMFRKEDLEDREIEIYTDWIMLWDTYVSLHDCQLILKYWIDKDLFYEWYDMKSLNFETQRIKENPQLKEYNLYNFFLFFWGKENPVYIQECKDSEERVEESKKLFYECFKKKDIFSETISNH